MSVFEYQIKLKELLTAKLKLACSTEWRATMNAGLYSPIIDVGVGPYALLDGQRLTNEHLELFEEHRIFFHQLCIYHLQNIGLLNDNLTQDVKEDIIQDKMNSLRWTNQNGRCFIAIEVENRVSRKHLMGGSINCAVLGKIGIAIGYTDEMHNAFLNLNRYFEFLQAVEKPTFNTRNLLIISKNQMLNALD